MVSLIDSLEDLGLVAREDVPGDRRSFGIEPTPKGKLILERALADAARIDTELLARLTLRDRGALRRALEAILDLAGNAVSE